MTETDVRLGAARITGESPVIRDLIESGAICVVGALFDIESGAVRFLN